MHPGQICGPSQGFSPAGDQDAYIQARPVCSCISHQLKCLMVWFGHVALRVPNQNILNNDPRIVTSASCQNWTGALASFSAQCAKMCSSSLSLLSLFHCLSRQNQVLSSSVSKARRHGSSYTLHWHSVFPESAVSVTND